MMNSSDVENGTVTTPSAADHTDNFTIGDESTLQPPPSTSMENDDLEGGLDDDDDDDGDDDNGPVHDLPTPEEYKARMSNNNNSNTNAAAMMMATSSGNGNVDVDAGNDEEHIHDLPTVEDYKSSRSFNDTAKASSGRRQGLWTFIILFLLTAIVTAIAVPLALKAGDEESSSNSSSSNANDFNPAPTAPAPAPTAPAPTPGFNGPTTGTGTTPGGSRFDQAVDYLVAVGVSERSALETANTAENYAVKWIANDDQMQFDIPSMTESSSGLQPHTRFTERYALAVLYYKTGGPTLWKYQLNFLQPIDHCFWYQDFVTTTGNIVRQGVSECNTLGEGFTEELVFRIELSNNGLTGLLPSELSSLHRLTHFIAPFNEGLTGNDSFMGLRSLAYLEHIELQYCSLTGAVPDYLGELRALTSIGFGNNFLEGQLPADFFMLTNLVLLGLDDNSLAGPISSFAAFSNIESLYLEDNTFTGPMTDALISSWPKMIELDLSDNQLDGPLPSNFWSMENCEVIDLNGNGFVGVIPDIPAPRPNMFFLSLHDNSLDFQIPASITNLPNLAHLDVANNNLILPYPTGMEQMTNLRYLFTGQNDFSEHPVPDWLAQMTVLRELSMKDNNLTGPIPTFFGSLTRMQVLDLDQNMLTGNIPDELGLLTGIDTIMLNRNRLSGNIPTAFALLNDLDVLLLDGNDLTGTTAVICNNPTINITNFVTDCGEPNPEISCPCCSLCCSDNNVTCNNFDWTVNLDPIWEYGYRRVVYSFSQNLLEVDSTVPP
eukprot:CAMPEP_0113492902 /NCGR_PEP_ID=MMETSP0014_2-20120614/28316_1 /TAXON_ID=2857 /ORGANISM="Nitzschia sp." /LENGTH=772 /DNA_ID=CAMNT_0000386749 /DNA_START=150 /DNA_END=2468 /DNA_ORIENTATION=- /assembly_acc=CAM_ASM_000159